ncbi:UTRA domain-containing protein [Neorhizobium sp. NCHU2750]|uniref:UTRA domain-containing protein n=1 Tax=Neorhizobium sp. NCHU2750 TaxID=1825976 RepID=UPI000E772F56|nr:GntR family transcriptional regulator [Neorhizobium sp. NCHU2750]
MLPDPLPLYEQIKTHVLDRIADGTFRPGSKLPSDNQLASELGTSRLTANRALRELTASGVLKRVNGVGTFVAQPRASSTFVLVHNIADDIRRRGDSLSIRTHKVELAKVTGELAPHLGLSAGAPIFHSLIVYCANESPVQLEDRFVSPEFAPDFLAQDFGLKSTTDYLQSIALPTRIEHEIQAALPNASEARLLEVKSSDPCLVVSRRTWVGAAVTTFTRFIHPGTRHTFITQENLDERR